MPKIVQNYLSKETCTQ